MPLKTALRYSIAPALLAVLLYLPSLRLGTVYDDNMLLPRIPTMTVKLAFTTDYWHFPNMLWYHLHYRPLALLSYAAIYGVFDMDPAMFHAA